MALTIDDVCAATRIGRTRIYQAINRGQLKARKFGNKTLVLPGDLEEFLDGLSCYPVNKSDQ